ncbi:GRXC1, partial [Linum perenne]
FSKTYCGLYTRVKQQLTQLGAAFKFIELDKESDGDKIQGGVIEMDGIEDDASCVKATLFSQN